MNYRPPESLEDRHKLDGFQCRSVEQTEWIRRHARQSTASNVTRVFVVTPVEGDEVVAYYAWTMAQLDPEDAPARILKGAGGYAQPVALLARLGVDERHEGRGLGYGLLRDVIGRVASLSEQIGCRGLLIHSESQAARNFYHHLIPEFKSSPTDELHLVLLLKDIKRVLGA